MWEMVEEMASENEDGRNKSLARKRPEEEQME